MSPRAVVFRAEQEKCPFRTSLGDCPLDRALLDEAGKTFAEAVAPVREVRGVRLLAAEDRVRRARSRATELLGRDPAHAALDLRFLEDRLRELGPRAVAVRGDVVEPVRKADDMP